MSKELQAEIEELKQDRERLALALKEYDSFNRLAGDVDAYLLHLSLWAFQNTEKLMEVHGSTEMPTRKDYLHAYPQLWEKTDEQG